MSVPPTGDHPERPIGLIAAIPQELTHFRTCFVERGRRTIAGLGFRSGTLDGRSVVTAKAGIGKVNAAVVATLLAHTFGCRALVLTGVAGGLDPALAVGDVVVAERLIAHDYGAVTGGVLTPYQPGVPPLPRFQRGYGYDLPAPLAADLRGALAGLELPAFSAAATGGTARRPRIVFGTVLTGDSLVNCAATRESLHARFGGQAVEMEGAAVAQVAERFAVPCVVVRALSDLAGADTTGMDFTAFVSEAAGVAAAIVRRIVPVL